MLMSTAPIGRVPLDDPSLFPVHRIEEGGSYRFALIFSPHQIVRARPDGPNVIDTFGYERYILEGDIHCEISNEGDVTACKFDPVSGLTFAAIMRYE